MVLTHKKLSNREFAAGSVPSSITKHASRARAMVGALIIMTKMCAIVLGLVSALIDIYILPQNRVGIPNQKIRLNLSSPS